MDPLQTRPAEPAVLIPAGYQFASLELAMAPGRDHLLFARNVLRKMCIHHGIDPDLALSTSENSRAAILRLYADHRSSGGRPHLIVEQMLARQTEDSILLTPTDAPQSPRQPIPMPVRPVRLPILSQCPLEKVSVRCTANGRSGACFRLRQNPAQRDLVLPLLCV